MGTFVLIRPAQTFYERINLVHAEVEKSIRGATSQRWSKEQDDVSFRKDKCLHAHRMAVVEIAPGISSAYFASGYYTPLERGGADE